MYLVLFTFIEVDDVGLRVWLGFLQLMDDIHLYACMFSSFQFIMVDGHWEACMFLHAAVLEA
jgi:hypothetical protein